MLVFQWAVRRPDEPDLRFLARIPASENELILDIGANGGQSAVAIAFIRPQARILSFEPVPTLWPELARVRRLLGRRFEFRRYGLGKRAGTFSLHIPVSGELPMTTRASISMEAAQTNCLELERAVGLPTRIESVSIEVRAGDSENLNPIAIKIDVEGTEFEVIQGLAKTIERNRPLIILERSKSFENCVNFFSNLGYVILVGQTTSSNEKILQGLSRRNWIACPHEMAEHILASAPSIPDKSDGWGR